MEREGMMSESWWFAAWSDDTNERAGREWGGTCQWECGVVQVGLSSAAGFTGWEYASALFSNDQIIHFAVIFFFTLISNNSRSLSLISLRLENLEFGNYLFHCSYPSAHKIAVAISHRR
jgi:hypothetical protein